MLDSPCKQLSVGTKCDQNPMCGRKDMKEIRGSLILTQLSWILCIDFQMNDLSPFSQSLWNISGSRTSQFRPPRGPDRLPESIPLPESILSNLFYGISPPILNRFLRFQRRCNLLIQTFPTMYDTSQ